MGILCTNYETLSNIFPSPLFFNSKPKTPNLFSVMPEIPCRASTHFCHARNLLSGIHVFIIPGFPPGKCGNDKVLDSRQVHPRDFLSGKIGNDCPSVAFNSKLKTQNFRSPKSPVGHPVSKAYRRDTKPSYKHHRRNFKTLAEKLKLANIELTFAG